MNHRFLVLPALALVPLAIFATACGGDDDKGTATDMPATPAATTAAAKTNTPTAATKLLLDPAKADALAHQALLTAKDLPGAGWQVSKTDKFDDGGPSANTAACKDIDSQQAKAKEKEKATRVARAEMEFSRSGADPIPTTVESKVNVFSDGTSAGELLGLFQAAAKSDNFAKCLLDTILVAVGPDVKVDSKSVTPFATAPESGSAVAYEFAFAVAGQSFAMRFETYIWAKSNTGNTLTVSGSKSAVTADLVKGALDKSVANVAAAGR